MPERRRLQLLPLNTHATGVTQWWPRARRLRPAPRFGGPPPWGGRLGSSKVPGPYQAFHIAAQSLALWGISVVAAGGAVTPPAATQSSGEMIERATDEGLRSPSLSGHVADVPTIRF